MFCLCGFEVLPKVNNIKAVMRHQSCTVCRRAIGIIVFREAGKTACAGWLAMLGKGLQDRTGQ